MWFQQPDAFTHVQFRLECGPDHLLKCFHLEIIEINTFIQQGSFKLIKSDDKKTFIMLQKIYISDRCCLFWTVYSSKKPEKNSTIFTTNINVFWAANQNIRMISERSCDWVVMTLKNQLWNHRNNLHFKIFSNRKQLF